MLKHLRHHPCKHCDALMAVSCLGAFHHVAADGDSIDVARDADHKADFDRYAHEADAVTSEKIVALDKAVLKLLKKRGWKNAPRDSIFFHKSLFDEAGKYVGSFNATLFSCTDNYFKPFYVGFVINKHAQDERRIYLDVTKTADVIVDAIEAAQREPGAAPLAMAS